MNLKEKLIELRPLVEDTQDYKDWNISRFSVYTLELYLNGLLDGVVQTGEHDSAVEQLKGIAPEALLKRVDAAKDADAKFTLLYEALCKSTESHTTPSGVYAASLVASFSDRLAQDQKWAKFFSKD